MEMLGAKELGKVFSNNINSYVAMHLFIYSHTQRTILTGVAIVVD